VLCCLSSKANDRKGARGQRARKGKEEAKEAVGEEAVGEEAVGEEEEEQDLIPSGSEPELLSPFTDTWAFGSDPTCNRSPSRRSGHVRGRATPNKIEIDTQFDV
jgi:hypothetical protein